MKNIEEYNRVLGFTGKEIEVKLKFNTFCMLCKIRLHKDDLALESTENNKTYYFHTDCVISCMKKISNIQFREEAKVKKRKQKTQRSKKEYTFTEDEKSYPCLYCKHSLNPGDIWVKGGKSQGKYHKNCWTRKRRITNNSKRTLSKY